MPGRVVGGPISAIELGVPTIPIWHRDHEEATRARPGVNATQLFSGVLYMLQDMPKRDYVELLLGGDLSDLGEDFQGMVPYRLVPRTQAGFNPDTVKAVLLKVTKEFSRTAPHIEHVALVEIPGDQSMFGLDRPPTRLTIERFLQAPALSAM